MVYVTADRMVDVVAGSYIANPAILVDGERIVKIGTSAELKPPADAKIINLTGLTLLPGLIDMHVHLTSDAAVQGYAALEASIPDSTIVGVQNARTTLMAGFTTMRNVGARPIPMWP